MSDASPLIAELRDLAASIAQQVGSEVMSRRAGGFDWTTKSSPTDVVTEIDTWAEATIVEAIRNARPDDGLVGEEGASSESSTGVVWIIDPIDGTTNLFYDIPGFSVSIGVELDGSPVAGAVFDPVRNELFAAGAGLGATRNGEPISPTPATDLTKSLIGTGFSYSAENRSTQAAALTHVMPAVRDIRRLGGAALDLCAVAVGRLDGFFERGLAPWDHAAGAVIAREAGAIVSVGDLTYAAAPGIASQLVELLDAAGV